MDLPQEFTGIGTIHCGDGSALRGERHYSITLVPWYEPTRPLAIGSWIELHGEEPLELENQQLSVRLDTNRWLTFRIVNVSETPPHHYTFIAQGWPSSRSARSVA
jgi:hypothetical protein